MTSAANEAFGPAPRVLTRAWSLARLRDGLGRTGAVSTPCALLLAGALIAYPFSLDQRVALERLLGLVATSGIALIALVALPAVPRSGPALVCASVLALIAGVWIIAASGPEVFRGSVGNSLDAVFRPVFGMARLTDPVEVSNTRFIVGYNGLADLCLVAIFGCGALLLAGSRRSAVQTAGLAAAVGVAVVLLVGTGARGGLTGLAAGICVAGLAVWPRRYAILAVVAAPAVLAVAALGILDKGLEFSSTAGRLNYWADLARLLVEYPLTGVGLGVDTAYRVALQYEINPDPERVFYAHNTFVQTYLEQGPLGCLGMLVLACTPLLAAVQARRCQRVERRTLLVAGLGLAGGLEAHGLTDQVVTTNVGTGLLLLAIAAGVAGLGGRSSAIVARWVVQACVSSAILVVLTIAIAAATNPGRAQLLLNIGGLQMNQAFALEAQSPVRADKLAAAERTLQSARDAEPSQAAVLRDLAWVRAARYDDSGALEALRQATDPAASTRLDAFDQLQIAHAYRDLGFADDAYAWASRAYAAWGRSPEDAVMLDYAYSTLTEPNARTLADQAEAAMRARRFGQAHSLFEEAIAFQPDSAYLQDRIGASKRAIDKYGTSPAGG